jgi:hypothetical protein
MKIPGEKTNKGFDRLQFFCEVRDACFYSQEMRKQQYNMLKRYYLFGCGQDVDGTPYNKIEPIIDTLLAFLYSADSTRFSGHLGPEVDQLEWLKIPAITKAINTEWMSCGADQIFGQAAEWATVYNTEIVKMLPKKNQIAPYIVDPHNFGVYREDLIGLDRQEAIAHEYYITRSQLEWELRAHPNREKILSRLQPRALESKDTMPEGLRRIIVTNQAGVAPIVPGQTVTGNADIWVPEHIEYMPGVNVDVIKMVELWVKDDDQDGDYQTVTIAQDDVIIYDRPNIFIKHEQPFVQVCPLPMNGYFWGRSILGTLIGLQSWRNIRVGEIQRMLALQAKPPHALTGWSGLVDETSFSLNQPGGVLNGSDPMGKVESFAPKVPEDLWKDVAQIDEMFMEAAGLPPILMGRGESGVRSGRQTSELSRLGSSRTKKRALCVEDSLENLATKMYKIMRKYFDTKYHTAAVDKMPPIAFTLEQAPSDTLIKVDAHSNSPLFVEDQKTLAIELLEAKAITRSRYVEILNPPMKDVILQELPLIEKKEAEAAAAKMKHDEAMAAQKHGGQMPLPGMGGNQQPNQNGAIQ